MVAVVAPGVVAQHDQVITHLARRLPELLLLLPASPALHACRTQGYHQR
jgi:hypothetical protein